MTRRYAEDTQVPVSKSRAEIDKLLRDWKAESVQWSDNYADEEVVLRFSWKGLVARFDVQLAPMADLEKQAIDKRTGYRSERKLSALMEHRGRHEHRLLLLWIKAALNACDAGIVEPEAIFLPFIEDGQGYTVAERVVSQLSQLKGTTRLMLGGGK